MDGQAKLNTSGITPLEYNVVIHIPEAETQTAGGLLLTDEAIERDQTRMTRGTLVAVSPMAFSFEEWPEGESTPQPGQQVIFEKYAGGELHDGDDGEKYRVVKDKQVVAYYTGGGK
ncbi:MAG: co-chaperone GroES [Pseudomonadota bacterium]